MDEFSIDDILQDLSSIENIFTFENIENYKPNDNDTIINRTYNDNIYAEDFSDSNESDYIKESIESKEYSDSKVTTKEPCGSKESYDSKKSSDSKVATKEPCGSKESYDSKKSSDSKVTTKEPCGSKESYDSKKSSDSKVTTKEPCGSKESDGSKVFGNTKVSIDTKESYESKVVTKRLEAESNNISIKIIKGKESNISDIHTHTNNYIDIINNMKNKKIYKLYYINYIINSTILETEDCALSNKLHISILDKIFDEIQINYLTNNINYSHESHISFFNKDIKKEIYFTEYNLEIEFYDKKQNKYVWNIFDILLCISNINFNSNEYTTFKNIINDINSDIKIRKSFLNSAIEISKNIIPLAVPTFDNNIHEDDFMLIENEVNLNNIKQIHKNDFNFNTSSIYPSNEKYNETVNYDDDIDYSILPSASFLFFYNDENNETIKNSLQHFLSETREYISKRHIINLLETEMLRRLKIKNVFMIIFYDIAYNELYNILYDNTNGMQSINKISNRLFLLSEFIVKNKKYFREEFKEIIFDPLYFSLNASIYIYINNKHVFFEIVEKIRTTNYKMNQINSKDENLEKLIEYNIHDTIDILECKIKLNRTLSYYKNKFQTISDEILSALSNFKM